MSTSSLILANQDHMIAMLRTVAACGVGGAVLLIFRPLLVGIARAVWLLAVPRLSREQQRARQQMRDRRLLQRHIDASTEPSLTAELRMMAASD